MSHQASLGDQLWKIWQRLGPHWGRYFTKAGLSLSRVSKARFLEQLNQRITINRELEELAEFSRRGHRGIEPGDPARSLFYHILASPHVTPHIDDKHYPTMADLEVTENYIYSAARLSIAQIKKRAKKRKIAIVVFAYEYATAADTVHGRHADLCFSRTGIARVGNAPPNYVPQARGYFPDSGSEKKVHVVPARYGAFIAFQMKANKATIGPVDLQWGDKKRFFWVPVHKLFNGPECIKDKDIELTIKVHHLNEKIRQVHLALLSKGFDTGWTVAEMEHPPFKIRRGLAKFDEREGLVKPVPHRHLLEPARTAKGKLVGFRVPAESTAAESSTLWFQPVRLARRSPEYVHAKHMIKTEDGREQLVYLPDYTPENINDVVQDGDYRAANFVDWTADGWVHAACPALDEWKSLSAYSILAQPDFFPLVKQKDLTDWNNSLPPTDQQFIWAGLGIGPNPLSNARWPANIMLHGAGFDSTDDTMTAIVGVDRRPGPKGRIPPYPDPPLRESTLPWKSSDLFDPGWDASRDFNYDDKSPGGTFHLTNYGLGSPYAEDTMFCASLSSYWPGAVPDVTRLFAPGDYPGVTPILDDQANWDGGHLPMTNTESTYYKSFGYADYVQAIWKNKFNYAEFARVSLEDYTLRTYATARVYQFLSVNPSKRNLYPFKSFRHPNREEYASLRSSGWNIEQNRTFRVEVAYCDTSGESLHEYPQIYSIHLRDLVVLFAGRTAVAMEYPRSPGKFSVTKFV